MQLASLKNKMVEFLMCGPGLEQKEMTEEVCFVCYLLHQHTHFFYTNCTETQG